MPRKLLHIGHQLRSLGAGSSAANASAESDGLASYFALKGSEDELVGWRGGVENVEAGPVGMRGRSRQSVKSVPEESSGVGEVAVDLSG